MRGGVDPLDRGRGLGTRLAVKARAEERVDDHVGLLDSGRLDGVETLVAQNPRCDPAVASVRAAAADDGDPVRIGEQLQHLAGDRGPGPLHQLRRGLRVAGIRSSAARISAAVYSGSSIGCDDCDCGGELARVRHRQVDRARFHPLGPGRDVPESRTDGFGRPAISMSFQANARATPNPSAFPTASLPAKRPA